MADCTLPFIADAAFDVGKGNEDPAQLRCRFAGELSWFAGMIDVFRDV